MNSINIIKVVPQLHYVFSIANKNSASCLVRFSNEEFILKIISSDCSMFIDVKIYNLCNLVIFCKSHGLTVWVVFDI